MKYQLAAACPSVVPMLVSCDQVVWPDRQCTRHVGEKTPVPAGRAAMSASVPAWNSSTKLSWAGELGACGCRMDHAHS